jgi:hypothetical protein
MRLPILAALCAIASAPAVADGCRTVHGRMSLANGAPSVRIWVVGGHRILGVVQVHQKLDDLPANIRQIWAARGVQAMWSSDLFGDYRVCPVTRSRPGRMQLVTVAAGSNLRLRQQPRAR